jgi:hypothetical protein
MKSKPRNGFKIRTGVLSGIIALLLFPDITGRHGAGMSRSHTGLGSGSSGRPISESAVSSENGECDMKPWVRIGILGAVFSSGLVFPASAFGPFGCTIVMAARDGLVLAGNNEDRNHPETIVTFIPATEKYFGRVVFGYDDAPFQGGMNDRGLFIDGNALRPTGWSPVPGKPTFAGVVIMVVLGTCATCEDVRAFFEQYNVPGLGRARFPVADRTGASMVVEYGQGGVQFVKSDTWYQIATNFVMSNVEGGDYPCWRYRAADKIMSGAGQLSERLIREVLEKTRQTGGSRTVYSNIYDLKNGVVLTYNRGNFDQAVEMNLAEELRKGGRRVDLESLFKGSPGANSRAWTRMFWASSPA